MANEYASERSEPSVPTCGSSKLALEFTGAQLLMKGGKKQYAYPAQSGKPGAFEPIPRGSYWIQPDELWECGTLRQLNFWLSGTSCDSSGWGMFRITIHPYPATDTKGRGGFFIHGGNHTGSAGCINLGLKVSEFVSDLKAELTTGASCYIPLTVD